jgi:hypothetical protein
MHHHPSVLIMLSILERANRYWGNQIDAAMIFTRVGLVERVQDASIASGRYGSLNSPAA